MDSLFMENILQTNYETVEDLIKKSYYWPPCWANLFQFNNGCIVTTIILVLRIILSTTVFLKTLQDLIMAPNHSAQSHQNAAIQRHLCHPLPLQRRVFILFLNDSDCCFARKLIMLRFVCFSYVNGQFSLKSYKVNNEVLESNKFSSYLNVFL